MRFKIHLQLLIILFVVSCANEDTFNSKEDLLSYLNNVDNGFVHQKSINGFDFTLVYRPTDLLVSHELNNEEITKGKLKALKEKYNKFLYFNLSISINNQELLSTIPNSRNEYGKMVNNLAFGMSEKVNLFTQNKDTLTFVDFIYPRMYGISKATTIMFVFSRDRNKFEDDFLNFTIEDLGLYTGEVRFKVPTDIINNEPHLSFNNKINEH